ncbi:zinc transporter 7 [Anopheles arabiensis]|uniref:AGAP004461-PA n=6 Tax=gambiae species complex TaxID=44542 RepID=Q7QA30_ANOGA|nr:zinc transporter 7 [Anopheles arabiensis]XP_040158524.1 zinc transporter 7 [Anopheles arabiensis]XP_040158529.1 zinc transporter 7 [Anopheles arabiensis]XP_040220491.1 zinc transporter 7 [Anopheles coluzzii]XP_041764663.1 zinc transporter 7 [Anopheles merus]XP_041764664.1 zinc transporter 7 [Anopheles merus]XP_313758.4 zinc transporter 7 [Anopheles gambiae]EAA09245.4 AGAP004461-PA [Anopheles gambiae str. PEST]EGK97183.1 AGAP004461-PB [Anopheles gambiae str. PEST]
MLPLTHKDSRGCGYRIREKFNSWSRLILSDRNSRNLFLFLLLNLSFAFVELMYGIWTNSLGLISDSFHMFFDCTGLLAGLAASVITKWRANEKYSYGYVRAEVLAGFVNSLFLLFIAFFIMSEAVERAIEPPEVKHERLFVVSVLGLLVNLVGIYAFQHGGAHGHSHGGGGGHGHSHGGGGGGSHGHSHGGGMNHHSHDTHSLLSNHNDHHGHSHGGSDHHHSHGGGEIVSTNSQIMRGVFLHILADTLGSVGVIISAVLMQVFGWMRADPICSMFIALTIGLSTLSLIKESVMVLMQRQPVALDRLLPSCYQKVTGLAGVYSVQEPHFWTLCTDVYVGVIKLEVSKNVDPKYVVQHTRMIFEAIGVRQINIQLDYTAM